MALLSATLYLARKSSNTDRILRWVPAKDGDVPAGAIEVGRLGGRGGEFIYIGRVCFTGNNIVPGTVIPSRNACFVAWKGVEYEIPEYCVLVNTDPELCHVRWSPLKDGAVPLNALKVGYDASCDELLYLARARPPGVFGTHAGYMRSGENAATIGNQGEVYQVPEFKVLCRDAVRNFHRPDTS